jgi:hypothetical protein
MPALLMRPMRPTANEQDDPEQDDPAGSNNDSDDDSDDASDDADADDDSGNEKPPSPTGTATKGVPPTGVRATTVVLPTATPTGVLPTGVPTPTANMDKIYGRRRREGFEPGNRHEPHPRSRNHSMLPTMLSRP